MRTAFSLIRWYLGPIWSQKVQSHMEHFKQESPKEPAPPCFQSCAYFFSFWSPISHWVQKVWDCPSVMCFREVSFESADIAEIALKHLGPIQCGLSAKLPLSQKSPQLPKLTFLSLSWSKKRFWQPPRKKPQSKCMISMISVLQRLLCWLEAR